MLRLRSLRRCRAAATQTLTAWLTRLALDAEGAPAATGSADTGSTTGATAAADAAADASAASASPKSPAEVWRELEAAATHANALHETDTLLSILQCLARKRQYPHEPQAWARLAKQLLPYGGIEQSTVLCYPGRSDAVHRRDETGRTSSSTPSYLVFPSRETLLMSGGVVPLSARVPCGDGRAVALFLRAFTAFVHCGLAASAAPPMPAALEAVAGTSEAVLEALRVNGATLELELLMPAVVAYLELLHTLDVRTALAAAADARLPPRADRPHAAERDEAGDVANAPTRLLLSFADGLSQRAMTCSGNGARLVLYYLADGFAATVEATRASATAPFAEELYWAQQRYLLTLTRACMRAVQQHYTHNTATEVALTGSSTRAATAAGTHRSSSLRKVGCDLVAEAPMHQHLQALYDHVDVLFQQNTNAGNPLQLADGEAGQLREALVAAQLRALRLEIAAPDAYLRRALGVVDRVPTSMAIEGELIAGKVRLLDLDSDTVDDEGRAAIYADLLTSLRNLVEMRPRLAQTDSSNAAGGASSMAAAAAGDSGTGEEEDTDGEQVRLDAATQALLQRAHADVITAFCAAHSEEWSNEAYNILVAHKYNGVKITNDLIRPVVDVFSRRGDCRVFSLVDLCVLYSNEPVDMHTIALLFRTCAAAGDHFRARTFLQLLSEVIPGFLVKCPSTVREALQELKLLDPPPRHLFVSTEDELVQSALGEVQECAVRRLPGYPASTS